VCGRERERGEGNINEFMDPKRAVVERRERERDREMGHCRLSVII
jgi:hypothetical protein